MTDTAETPHAPDPQPPKTPPTPGRSDSPTTPSTPTAQPDPDADLPPLPPEPDLPAGLSRAEARDWRQQHREQYRSYQMALRRRDAIRRRRALTPSPRTQTDDTTHALALSDAGTDMHARGADIAPLPDRSELAGICAGIARDAEADPRSRVAAVGQCARLLGLDAEPSRPTLPAITIVVSPGQVSAGQLPSSLREYVDVRQLPPAEQVATPPPHGQTVLPAPHNTATPQRPASQPNDGQ